MMALYINRQALDRIIEQAQRDHPIETCGIVASKVDGLVATRFVPMINNAASETFFLFDSREQFRVFQEMDDHNEVCRVIYHSHTASEAYPSKEDICYAGIPEAHYLIVSTWMKAMEAVRSFRIIRGKIIEENIEVIES